MHRVFALERKLLSRKVADAISRSKQDDLRLDIAVNALHALPWELTLRRVGIDWNGTVLRSDDDERALTAEVSYLQDALSLIGPGSLVPDGRWNDQTTRALRSYQERVGLRADGVPRDEVLRRLQADRSELTQGRSTVLLVQPSRERQLLVERGSSTEGVELWQRYDRSGFRVIRIQEPGVHAVQRAFDAAARDQTPSNPDLTGGLRRTTAGVELAFLGGQHDAATNEDAISVTGLDLVIERAPRASDRPAVILDIDTPSTPSEMMRQLFLRNEFAAGLFALGRCAAVVATGIADAGLSRVHDELIDGFCAGTAISDVVGRLQRGGNVISGVPGGDATALFTNLPWLRLTPR